MEVKHAYQDLVWAAQSASLVRDDLTACLVQEAELERLRSHQTFEAFRKFLLRREGELNHKVGMYFELLVEFLISDVLKARIIHRGEQVVENGRTVGEIDFIFEHHSTIWHLEAAVKFYMALPEAHSNGSCLVGPNSRDCFEAKIDRMFSHQLPLSRRFCPAVTQRVAYVKGRIFYPANSPDVSYSLPSVPRELNPEHDVGVWCRVAECHDVLRSIKADCYWLRGKPHWLSDARKQIDSIDVSTISEISAYLVRHFANSHRPIMLSALIEVDGWLEEVERVFVVNNLWPDGE